MSTRRIAAPLICAVLLILAPVALRADSFAYISGTDNVYAWDVTTNTTSVLFTVPYSLDIHDK